MIIVVIIIGAFVFSSLMTTVYHRIWNKNLEVKLRFKDEAVIAGSESELTETIINRKWLFLPVLQVAFETHKNLKFGQEENISVSDRCYKRDIFSVGGYQKITRTIPFQCSKRGFYEIREVDVITRNPLLTDKLYMSAIQNIYIYGYPKIMENVLLDVAFQKIMGEMQTKRNIYEDPFEFQGIREYQPSDPMSRINWKASARSQDWMVNLYGSTNSQEIMILLDLHEETTGRYEEVHEEQMSLAVTLAERFIDAGIPVGLLTNGVDIKMDQTFRLSAGTGKQQLENINRGLSRIDLSKRTEVMKTIIREERDKLSHLQKTFIMISKNQRMDCYEEFLNLIHQGVNGFWIHTGYSGTECTLPENRNITFINWEVGR